MKHQMLIQSLSDYKEVMVCFQEDIQEAIDLIEKLVYFVRDSECKCYNNRNERLPDKCERCQLLDTI